jgi:hypothetical protein
VHCDACVRAGEADLDNSAAINEIARRQKADVSMILR